MRRNFWGERGTGEMRGRKSFRKAAFVLGFATLFGAGALASGALGMTLEGGGSTDSSSTATDTSSTSTGTSSTDATTSTDASTSTEATTSTDATTTTNSSTPTLVTDSASY